MFYGRNTGGRRFDETIIDAAKEEGTKIPASIKEAPDLETDLVFFYNAFCELATDRVDSKAPIPWSSIHHYGERYGIDSDDDFEMLVKLIRVLDNLYLKNMQEKEKANG